MFDYSLVFLSPSVNTLSPQTLDISLFFTEDSGGSQKAKEAYMNVSVKPELPSGFPDYGPTQMLAIKRILGAIERVYRRFGFVPLQTSIGHKRLVLTGGEASSGRKWDMRVDSANISTDDEQRVTARFDLTVPLARYVAANMGELRFPFRRYECGEVFRGESPQAGRFCQFTQFDADIVGAPTGPADAEIILCMAAVMRELGITRFLIKVNNRKILNGFAERVGLSPGSTEAAMLLRIMDKADKIGLDGVLSELAGKAESEENKTFVFDSDQLDQVRAFMTLTEGITTNTMRLATLKGYFAQGGAGAEGVAELEQIASLLEAGGMPAESWMVDSSVARGLGYYTGPVFETTLLDKPELGSVYSGGRFDDLVARFTNSSLPAVGASVGVSRLLAALTSLNALGEPEPEVNVFIVRMDAKLELDYFILAAELRATGLSVELGMSHQDMSMKAQMATALARRAPFILFYGDREKQSSTVQVKVTADRSQRAIARTDLAHELLTFLRP